MPGVPHFRDGYSAPTEQDVIGSATTDIHRANLKRGLEPQLHLVNCGVKRQRQLVSMVHSAFGICYLDRTTKHRLLETAKALDAAKQASCAQQHDHSSGSEEPVLGSLPQKQLVHDGHFDKPFTSQGHVPLPHQKAELKQVAVSTSGPVLVEHGEASPACTEQDCYFTSSSALVVENEQAPGPHEDLAKSVQADQPWTYQRFFLAA